MCPVTCVCMYIDIYYVYIHIYIYTLTRVCLKEKDIPISCVYIIYIYTHINISCGAYNDSPWVNLKFGVPHFHTNPHVWVSNECDSWLLPIQFSSQVSRPPSHARNLAALFASPDGWNSWNLPWSQHTWIVLTYATGENSDTKDVLTISDMFWSMTSCPVLVSCKSLEASSNLPQKAFHQTGSNWQTGGWKPGTRNSQDLS